MFVDTIAGGGGGWGEQGPVCKSCRQEIAANEAPTELQFDSGTAHQLHEMNGTYHAHCARPLLSMKRAYDMMGRFGR